MADTSAGPNFSLRNVARALKHRNYRLFFSGQSISLIGTWMQQIAVRWLVYRLLGSAFLLGVVSFANNIPVFLGTPFTGVLADRWNRHKAIVIIQIAAMVQAFILAALVLTNLIKVWEVIALGFLLGVIGAFDMPFRQAFIVEMVEDREDLSNAIALNSTMFNSARLLGPSIAGLLVAALGEGWCFLLNGISYIPVIWALLLMKPVAQKRQEIQTRMLEGLKEGFRYAFGFPPIRTLLVL